MVSLVEGRDCGPCTVCCETLTVDTPELQKMPGKLCRHCVAGGGCSVYETRAPVCRSWFCGWRRIATIPVNLRPDLSGILVREVADDHAPNAAAEPGLAFQVLTDRSVLRQPGVAEAIAAVIAADVPAYLVASAPPGFAGRRGRLNEKLGFLVKQKNRTEFLKQLLSIHAALAQQPKAKVALSYHGNQVG